MSILSPDELFARMNGLPEEEPGGRILSPDELFSSISRTGEPGMDDMLNPANWDMSRGAIERQMHPTLKDMQPVEVERLVQGRGTRLSSQEIADILTTRRDLPQEQRADLARAEARKIRKEDESGMLENLAAGTAEQLIGGTGSAMDFLGAKYGLQGLRDTGSRMRDYGQTIGSAWEAPDLRGMTPKDIFASGENFDKFMRSQARSAPFTLATIAGSIVGGWIAAPIATYAAASPAGLSVASKFVPLLEKSPKIAAGLSWLGKNIGATLPFTAYEALFEGGGTFDEARARALKAGASAEDADRQGVEAAESTFLKNMAILTGSNAVQWGLAKGMTKAFKGGKGVLSGLMREGADALGNSVMEGGEEYSQNWAQKSSLGDEFDPTSPENLMAAASGAGMGLLFHAGGRASNLGLGKLQEKMDEASRRGVEAARADLTKQAIASMTPEDKELVAVALNNMAEQMGDTPEGNRIREILAMEDEDAALMEAGKIFDLKTGLETMRQMRENPEETREDISASPNMEKPLAEDANASTGIVEGGEQLKRSEAMRFMASEELKKAEQRLARMKGASSQKEALQQSIQAMKDQLAELDREIAGLRNPGKPSQAEAPTSPVLKPEQLEAAIENGTVPQQPKAGPRTKEERQAAAEARKEEAKKKYGFDPSKFMEDLEKANETEDSIKARAKTQEERNALFRERVNAAARVAFDLQPGDTIVRTDKETGDVVDEIEVENVTFNNGAIEIITKGKDGDIARLSPESLVSAKGEDLNGKPSYDQISIRKNGEKSTTVEKIEAAASEAALSPNNNLPEPTQAQKEAGNYKKGSVSLSGLDISIENPRGSVRSGTDRDGKKWSQTMVHHYGYIKGSVGKDKDHVDVFIGPNPDNQKVFVVDQVNPKDGAFDEHKAMLGFDTVEEARQGYLSNYEPGWKGLGAITEIPLDEFKSWVKDGSKTKKPLALGSATKQTEAPQPSNVTRIPKVGDVYRSPAGVEFFIYGIKNGEIWLKDPKGGTTMKTPKELADKWTPVTSQPEAQKPEAPAPVTAPDAGGKPNAAPEPAQKKPWQMTRAEWVEEVKSGRTYLENDKAIKTMRAAGRLDLLEQAAYTTHSKLVGEAFRDNRVIPPEVLAEYPDLQKAEQQPAATDNEDPRITKLRADLERKGAGEVGGDGFKILQSEDGSGHYFQVTHDGVRTEKGGVYHSTWTREKAIEEALKEARFNLGWEKAGEKKPEPINQSGEEANAEPGEQPINAKGEESGTATVKTDAGTEIQVRYQVVEAGDLIASNKTNFSLNPEYPQELQPRERARAASQAQVEGILSKMDPERLGESLMATDGAPIVGPDMVVESGNGRTLALKLMYERGLSDQKAKYREWLEANAGKFGVSLGGTKNPILVRVRETDVDRVAFVNEANASTVSAMSAAEQAMVDARKLTNEALSTFVANDDGDILRNNGPFIGLFKEQVVLPNEMARFVDKDGRISQDGINRIRNAIFAKAYGDSSALARMSESTDDNAKNITKALVMAAPRMAQASDLIARELAFPLSIADDVVEAARTLADIRMSGNTVESYLSQSLMFSDEISPTAKEILRFFDKYKLRAKMMADLLNTYADILEAKGDPRTESLFAEAKPTKAEIFEAAFRKVTANERAAENSTRSQGTLSFKSPVGGEKAGEDSGGNSAKEGGAKEETEVKPPSDETKSGTIEPKEQPNLESTPEGRIAARVRDILKAGGKIATGRELFDIADQAYGGTQAEGKYISKDAYDGMELGINLYLRDDPGIDATRAADLKTITETIRTIRARVLAAIPTQSKRSEEQDEFQQFSTPPDLAAAVAWLGNLGSENTVLEPSAGIGGLVAFAPKAGAKVIVNELSDRRAAILNLMGFDRLFHENAEQINNILPDDVKPDRVLMNPPFSATAGRIKGERKTSNATKHMEQALKRLTPGGRLVAILGKGMADDAPSFTSWWNGIKKQYNVRANVELSGKGYQKYGTTFGNVVVVIDKTGATPEGSTITGKFDDVIEALPKLEGIRNALENGARTEQNADQPGGESQAGGDRGAGSDSNVPPSARPGGGSNAGDGGSAGGSQKGGSSRNSGRSGRSGARSGSGSVSTGSENAPGLPAAPVSDSQGTGGSEEPEGSGGSGIPGSSGSDEPDAGISAGSLTVEKKSDSQRKEDRKNVDADDQGTYEGYVPAKVSVAGAKEHPADLVESAAMAAVMPLDPDYSPMIPKKVVESGALSIVQLETIIYAGQAFGKEAPDGTRRGFFVGDGTGVGKGREIAGVIMDQMARGHGKGKALWVSDRQRLVNDAKRDWSGAMNNPDDVFSQLADCKGKKPIDRKKGILFTAYSMLRGEDRFKQVEDWLGKDFDGVIVLDECHNANNTKDEKGTRGTKRASQQALKTMELVRAYPRARVLYVSATGATEVKHLSLLERLGLWGEGTAFPKVDEFIDNIEAGGVAAMEIVSRDMKAMGMYLSRQLSFRAGPNGGPEDVTFDRLVHALTEEQRAVYNKIAEAWQITLQNFEAALDEIGANGDGGEDSAANAQARSSARSQYWGAHQRCFNQIITALQTPVVLEQIQKDLDSGKSAVIQLTKTNESDQERAYQKIQEEGGSLDDIDITPKDTLINLVRNSFPVQQYETVSDEDGNKITVPVTDRNGNPVLNKEAVAMRDQLIVDLNSIRFPQAPLDMILDRFGTDMVAEVTGRSERIVREWVDGRERAVRERRSKNANQLETEAFQGGKKRILVFSEAGGTGASYHADKNAKNQQKRVHYLLQPGWMADRAVQGLGRTHRSNEAHKPHYWLVTTDIPGQKRFLSTIARRLEQLGALTAGERKTGNRGLFSEKDNLESPYATDAVGTFFRRLLQRSYPELSPKAVLSQMGLEAVQGTNGTINDSRIPSIRQFLNRMLSLDLDTQNAVFDAFSQIMDHNVEQAIEQGTLRTGLETLQADFIEILHEETVYEDPSRGISTQYVELELQDKVEFLSFNDVNRESNPDFKGFYRNNRSKRIYAIYEGRTLTDLYGGTKQRVTVYGVATHLVVTKNLDEIEDMEKWTQVTDKAEARAAWEKQIEATPTIKKHTEHLVTGVILPIWDRLKGEYPRVVRVVTKDGRRLIGRLIDESNLRNTLDRLGASARKSDLSNEEILDRILNQHYEAELANGWTISVSRVNNEKRIELDGPNFAHRDSLRRVGLFSETISWKERYFIPTADASVLGKVLESWPMVNLFSTRKGATALAEESSRKLLEEADHADAAADRINARTPDAKMPAGLSLNILSWDPFGKKGKKAEASGKQDEPGGKQTPAFEYEDEDMEAAHKVGMEGIRKQSMKSWLEERIQAGKNYATRTFPLLPHDHFHAEVVNDLLKLQKQVAEAQRKTVMYLRDILDELDPNQYDLFCRAVVLEDLNEDAAEGMDLPEGYTPEGIETELERVRHAADEDPKVKAALSRRRQMTESAKADYLKAARKAGVNLDKKFTRGNYFRHQVLHHYNEEQRATPGTGKKLKAPTNRGWLKGRQGTTGALNEQYLQAEFEVVSQMLYDTEVFKVISNIDRHYNLVGHLKALARTKNEEAVIDQCYASLKDAVGANGNVLTDQERREEAEKMFRVIYNQKQAIAIGRLAKLAAEGLLPDGENGEWADVVEALVAEHGVRAAEAAEDVADPDALRDVSDGIEQGRLLKYLSWLANQQETDGELPPIGKIPALMFWKGVREKKERIKADLGEEYATWQTLVPDGYGIWQPREGSVFYKGWTLPEMAAKQLLEGGLSELGVTPEALKSIVAKGGRFREMVLPQNIIDTLNDLGRKQSALFGGIFRKPLAGWKWWVLYNPKRFIKYEVRNFSGDVEAPIMANGATFRQVHRAWDELYQVVVGGKQPTGDMADWIGRGGLQLLQRIQELHEVSALKQFTHLQTAMGEKDRNIVKRAWDKYWSAIDKTDSLREGLLRYATYLSYLEQMRANQGRPKNFGASLRDEIMGIHNIKDRAFRLSNELLGAYDEVSALGKDISDAVIPFFRFQEINFKRYIRLMKNAWLDGKESEQLAQAVVGSSIKVTGAVAWRIAKLVVKASMLWAMLAAYNNLRYPDEEEELPEDVRNRPHIILGRGANGEVRYFSRLGLIGDFLEWFGMDGLPYTVGDWLNGKRSLKEIATDMAKSPINKIFNGLTPVVKLPFEVALGVKTFPDVFKPRTVRDRWEYLADSLSVGDAYRRLRGRPMREKWGTPRTLWNFVAYQSDPLESSYWDIQDEKRRFMRRMGKGSGGSFEPTPKSNALYYAKQAMRYGDTEAVQKYLGEYFALGGTERGLTQSLKSMDPMYGLDDEERILFLADMDAEDRAKLGRAYAFYFHVIQK